MVTREITIILPDDVAQAADSHGLLTPESVQRLIQAEVERQQKADRLFEVADTLAMMDKGDLTEADITTEIAAARAERRARRADSR